jgi:hypothetical protein
VSTVREGDEEESEKCGPQIHCWFNDTASI